MGRNLEIEVCTTNLAFCALIMEREMAINNKYSIEHGKIKRKIKFNINKISNN